MIKKIIAVIMAVLMVAALCVTTAFAAYDKSKLDYGKPSGQYEVMPGVKYSQYAATSGTGKTDYKAQVSILEFDPADYVPVVYNGYSGSLSKLSNTYSIATQKDGYEIAGIINGSFFSMADGWLVEYFVSDGKVSCADNGNDAEVIAFMSDGKAHVVNSKLNFGLYLDGKPISGGLYAINKHYSKTATWTDGFYYYDSDCGRVADTYAERAGYEIICEKLDTTDLTVGGTLKGKVLEVKKNSSGSQVSTDANTASDKFVLFCLADSKYKTYAESLKAGSTVEISIDETVESSKEIIRSAQSVIANVGWLVKDGVDMTEKTSYIGTHHVETTYAQWTALGTKPDGTYVFFTSDTGSRSAGESLVLKDVAKIMIGLGCNNVWRMDGGGSTSMYVSNTGSGAAGYKLVTEDRSVADSIMIVKRSSMQKKEYKDALQAAITAAEKIVGDNTPDTVKQSIKDAKAVLNSKTSINSDYLKAIMNLQKSAGGTEELDELLNTCASLNTGDYCIEALNEIWAAYATALEVRGNASATASEISAAAQALKSAVANKGALKINVAGEKVANVSASRGGYSANIFDGVSSGTLYGSSTVWYGFTNGGYVTFDLGEKTSSLDKLSLCFMPGNSGDGIVCPKYFALSTSDDGKTWREVSKMDFSESKYSKYHEASTTATYWESFDLSNISTRYIKLSIEGSWSFVSEIELYKDCKPVENYIYVTGFDATIAAGNTNIFTEGFSGCNNGKIDVETANLKWTQVASLKPVGGSVYEVVYTVSNPSTLKTIDMPKGGLIIAAHYDDSNSDASIQAKTKANREQLAKLKVGDQVTLNGINPYGNSLMPGGFVSVRTNKLPSPDKYGTVDNKGSLEIDSKNLNGGKGLSATAVSAYYGSGTTIVDKDGKALTGSAVIGTGAVIKNGDTSITVIVKGDVNGDGKVDLKDATAIKRDIQKSDELEGVYKQAGLLSDYENIKMLDYTKVRRFIQFGTNY